MAHKQTNLRAHFPITHLVAPHIFETKNGELGTVIKLQGLAFETSPDELINQHHGLLHQSLCDLGEGMGVMVYVNRHRVRYKLDGDFDSGFLDSFNCDYNAEFASKPSYQNDIYLVVLYRGMQSGRVGKGISGIKGLLKKHIVQARAAFREKAISILNEKVSHLISSLKVYSPTWLDKEASSKSALLSFLSLIPNGGTGIEFARGGSFPATSDIKSQASIGANYPEGHLADYLSNTHVYFGRAIQFTENSKTRFGAMLSIKQYATQSHALMLNPLLHSDIEFISVNSFFAESKAVANKKVTRHQLKLENANDMALSQIDELHLAQDDIASNRCQLGYHHNSIMVLADSLTFLDDNILAVSKAYSEAGFQVVTETLAKEPAFWAQIPGNQSYIPRASLITSLNFSDFCPLHNFEQGYQDNNHLGSAVALLETQSLTPYAFNYHLSGSRDNVSAGHALVIGSNGSGKTVALAALDAQRRRYGGHSLFFDRDECNRIYVEACGGYYTALSPKLPAQTRFNPLLLEDNPANRQFCISWLASLCLIDGEESIPDDIREMLSNCIHYAFDELDTAYRTLSHATKILPVDFPRQSQLDKWLVRCEGDYGYLFDNDSDAFATSPIMGFDLTHFLDNEPAGVLAPLMQYLFYRIEQLMTEGQLTSIYLDEGWQYLSHPIWQKKLVSWLPTLRKKNAHVVLATQSADSIARSAIKHVFLDNVATTLFFANPLARKEVYDAFDINEAEWEFIKQGNPANRWMLIKQQQKSVIARLRLKHLPSYLNVFSTNPKNIKRMQAARMAAKENWLTHYMECDNAKVTV